MRLKHSGFTLVEIMVAFALLGAGALGIAKLMQNNTENMSQIESKDDMRTAYLQLQSILSNPEACKNTLQSVDLSQAVAPSTINIDPIKNKDGNAVYSVGSKLGRVTFDSFILKNYKASNHSAELVMTVKFKKGQNEMTRSRVITLIVNENSNAVDSCSAQGSDDSLWSKMATPDIGIFYNGGSVLIGTGNVNSGSSVPSLSSGTNNSVIGENSAAIGESNSLVGDNSFAFGSQNYIGPQDGQTVAQYNIGSSAFALGHDNWVVSQRSFALGFNSKVTQQGAVAIGNSGWATGVNSIAIGGTGNISSGTNSISIGTGNVAEGNDSMAFGYGAQALKPNSMAIGVNTKANHDNAIVLSNIGGTYASGATESSANDEITIASKGKIRLCTDGNLTTCQYISATGTSITSSKKLKENFMPLDKEEVLNKLNEINILTWNYKSQNDKNKRHIGPMAEDFYEIFTAPYSLEGANNSINTNTLFNFGLIGIQALNDKVEKLETRNQELEDLVVLMKEELKKLNQKINEIEKRN